MPRYAVTFSRAARKDIERLDKVIARRVFVKIERLAHDPRPSGCRKLHNEENAWRIRIGDYRVIYTIEDRAAVVDVVGVRHRSEAYR